jgi:hypothetical protein
MVYPGDSSGLSVWMGLFLAPLGNRSWERGAPEGSVPLPSHMVCLSIVLSLPYPVVGHFPSRTTRVTGEDREPRIPNGLPWLVRFSSQSVLSWGSSKCQSRTCTSCEEKPVTLLLSNLVGMQLFTFEILLYLLQGKLWYTTSTRNEIK